MKSVKTSQNPMKKNSGKCQICSDENSSLHFGVISCQPCKMFFKRNAEYIHKLSKCSLGDDCDVNIPNRHVCSLCRLKKCFAQGMKVEMFRSPRSKFVNQLTTTKQKYQSTKEISKSNHCSMNWDLIRSYEESQGIAFAENFLRDQLILPLKFRFKNSIVRQFLLTLSSKTRLSFEQNEDFLRLPSNDRLKIHRNSQISLKIFSTLSIIRQCRLPDQTGFLPSCVNLFGMKLIDLMKNFLEQLDSDFNVMKLVFFIFLFSTMNDQIDFNSKTIRQIQEKYIELTWKYLLWKCDYRQTVIFFSNLPRCLITFQNILHEFHQEKPLRDMMNVLIEEEN